MVVVRLAGKYKYGTIYISKQITSGDNMNGLQELTNNGNTGTSNLSATELGDINIFIGINGGGKSTLLRSIRHQILERRENERPTNQCTDLCMFNGMLDGDLKNGGLNFSEVSDAWGMMIERHPKMLKKALDMVKAINPSVIDVTINEDDQYLYATLVHGECFGESMGSGFVAAVSIAAAMFYAAGGFLLIDDLGTGLHLDSADDIADYIVEAAQDTNTQVFVATHDPSILSALKNASDKTGAKRLLTDVKSAYQLPNDTIDVKVLNF